MKDNWAFKKLGDLIELKYGFGLPERKRVFGEVPVYGSSGIVGYHKELAIKGPGIIVGRKGNIGAVYFSLSDFWPIDTTYYIEENRNRYDLKFLFFLLKTLNLNSLDTAAAVPGLSRESFYNIEAKLPIFPIQHKIASILSAYDILVKVNEQRIKVLEEMTRLIYKEWFVKFRFPGYEKANMVESELGKIPEGWEVRRVEEVVERIHPGKLYDSNTVKKSGNVPVLDQGRSGIIGYHDDEPGVKASEDNPVIVFANHTCYQNLILFSFSAIQNVLPFIPSEANFRNIFWLYWATKGLVRFNDYKGHWPEFINKKLIIPLPNICEKFGEIIRPIAVQSYKLEQQNNIFRQTRDILLPKLLSGEIDVSDLDIKAN